MVDAIDRTALEQWLRVRGASSSVIGYAVEDLGAEWRTAPERECATLLEGILAQATEPVVSLARVEGMVKVARALGYREHLLDAFVVDVLRITLRRLRAYGVLGLHLGASADEIKASHRLRIKEAHPDRLIGAEAAAQEAAERQVMELNQARALLYQPLEDVRLDGEDDLVLEPA
ncbi:MAG: J domain-containing protein, partial [Myxococcota bacterium]